MSSGPVPAGFVPELPPPGDAGDERQSNSSSRSRSPRGLDSTPKASFSQREAHRRALQRTRTSGAATPRRRALRHHPSEESKFHPNHRAVQGPHGHGQSAITEIDLHTVAVKIEGFHQTPLDGLYRRREAVMIANHPTFFHTQGETFLYKSDSSRWTISPTSLRNENLVEAAKRGETPGIAYQKAADKGMECIWMEFLHKRWVDTKPSVRTLNFEEYERQALSRQKRAAPLPRERRKVSSVPVRHTAPRAQPLPSRQAVLEPKLSAEQLLQQAQQEVRREARDEKRQRREQRASQKAQSARSGGAGQIGQIESTGSTASSLSISMAAPAEKGSLLGSAATSLPPAAAVAKESPLLSAASVTPAPALAAPAKAALLAAASAMAPKLPPSEASPLLSALVLQPSPPSLSAQDQVVLASTSKVSVLPPKEAPPTAPKMPSAVLPPQRKVGPEVPPEALQPPPQEPPPPAPPAPPAGSEALRKPEADESGPPSLVSTPSPHPLLDPSKARPSIPKTPPKAKSSFPKRRSDPGDDKVDSFLERLTGKAPKHAEAGKEQHWQQWDDWRWQDREWDWASNWQDQWKDGAWKANDDRWPDKAAAQNQWFGHKDSWWAQKHRESGHESKASWESWEWQDGEPWGNWNNSSPAEAGSGTGTCHWAGSEQAADKKLKDGKDSKEKAKEKKDKKEEKKEKKERKEKHKDKKEKDKKEKEAHEASEAVAKVPVPKAPDQAVLEEGLSDARKGEVEAHTAKGPDPSLARDMGVGDPRDLHVKAASCEYGFPPSVDGFFLFMRERERIRLRRERSQSYPWTDDAVLRHLRLRNVKKEHDRTSTLIRRLLLPLDDKWRSSTTAQQKRAVVRQYVLSVGLWRRFGTVDFINRAGLVSGDATPEDLCAKASTLALDLWKDGIHSCCDAYGPTSRAHAAELCAWLGEEACKHLPVAMQLHPRHGQQMMKSLVNDAGLETVRSGLLQVLNKDGQPFRSLCEKADALADALVDQGPVRFQRLVQLLGAAEGHGISNGVYAAEIVRDLLPTPICSSGCVDIDHWAPLDRPTRCCLDRLAGRPLPKGARRNEAVPNEVLLEELLRIYGRRHQLWPASIEDAPSVDLHLLDLRAQLAEFERYQRAKEGRPSRMPFVVRS
ncbi:Wdr53 [Symbiodinium natans]|uniref:Wdr53 protein n=1 Tax=Symbiodinium natans TaxID=878477 RepID=A0A812IP35_9DINO|nr:Wdr53 [Symbiodinium natans]